MKRFLHKQLVLTKKRGLLLSALIAVSLIGNQAWSQNFMNGSFENTTAPVACNYNLSNGVFTGFMANCEAYGAGGGPGNGEVDIIIAGCFNPSIPDGIRAICLAHVPEDEVSMELTAPLVTGNSYTISFWCRNVSDFSPQGDLLVGASTSPTAFGTQIYVCPTVVDTWVQFTFTFVAPNNATHICIKNAPGGAFWNHVDNFQFVNSCNPAWTTTTACSTDPPIDLDLLITGDTGGTWSGTGVTGNMFDPSAGTQSITYTAPGACDSTQTITVNTTAVASWNPPVDVCDGDAQIDLNTLITGTTGGTWSGTGVAGNMFDPSVGTQTITYTAGTAPCDDFSAQQITVGVQASAAWTPPVGLCTAAAPVDLNTTITGTAGGTWSGTGVTGSIFDPSSGSQTITYTVGTAPCDSSYAQLITVVANADASWTIPTGVCIGDAPFDLSTFITGNPGGTWSGTGVTGTMFDPSVGSQNITYSVGTAPCDATSAQMITVAPLANPAWTPPINICESDPLFDLTTIVTGDPGGTWSGTGVTGNNFDPAAGTQTLTYTVGTGGCQDMSAQTFTVNTAPDPSWNTLTMCVSDAPVNLTAQVTGLAGGTWSGTGMTGSVFDPFFGTQNITYSVSAGGCTATSTQAVTVLDPQLTMSSTNVSCFGLTDGTATVTVTGGSGGQNYLWNPSGQTTQTATNLGAGSYQVTVTDGTCSVVDSVTILEPAEITAALTRINGCAPDKGSAAVLANGGVGGFTYAWSPSGQTSANPTQLDSAMHTVVVTDANGCTYTDSILVQVLPAPAIVAMNDTTIIYPNCINLTATGGVSYEWTSTEELDCNSCPSPEACPILSNQYCVEGTDANGCKNTDCVIIDVEIICGEVFVPSAFSPNNDGENDLECVYSDCIENMTFSIYNRWGEKVFETNDMNICWDGTWKGKPLNSAVFVYVIDGYLINGQPVLQKGNISLIR